MEESLDLTLETTLKMCDDHDHIGSIMTPRYQTEVARFKTVPPTETFSVLSAIL